MYKCTASCAPPVISVLILVLSLTSLLSTPCRYSTFFARTQQIDNVAPLPTKVTQQNHEITRLLRLHAVDGYASDITR